MQKISLKLMKLTKSKFNGGSAFGISGNYNLAPVETVDHLLICCEFQALYQK